MKRDKAAFKPFIFLDRFNTHPNADIAARIYLIVGRLC